MRLVDHTLDPIGAREPEASRKAALDHRGAGQPGSRHVDDGGVGRSRRAAGPDAPLVDKMTLAPLSIAAIAAQHPAGPPPTTRTSAAKSRPSVPRRPLT